MAVRLRQAGIDDLVVLERADGVGGTWRDNTYPGSACDVPSHLYSFSFAPNPAWSRTYGRQPEIRAYLERVADDFGVRPSLRLGADVRSARWDDDAMVWRLETSRGPLSADVLVSGSGGLVEPRYPDVPGRESFAGPAFHSARWDHGVDLTGKRVAVIGTGASAAQFVPELTRVAAKVVLFQRTPPWVLPRADRTYSELQRRLGRRVPATLRCVRAGHYWWHELLLLAFHGRGLIRSSAQARARRHLAAQVPDPALRALLTPDYEIGCKRVLISDDYYPAVASDRVELVPHAVREVRSHGVVGADGVEHPVDVLIFGTGFCAMQLPLADRLVGREGRTLAEQWRAGAVAHRGTTVAGFPNLFLLLGPNTALGHSSVVLMIEAQIGYVLEALRTLEAYDARALEVRRAAQERYDAELQAQLSTTVWNAGGCRSWYRGPDGRNFALWPAHVFTFQRQMARFDAASYLLRRRAAGGDSRRAAGGDSRPAVVPDPA